MVNFYMSCIWGGKGIWKTFAVFHNFTLQLIFYHDIYIVDTKTMPKKVSCVWKGQEWCGVEWCTIRIMYIWHIFVTGQQILQKEVILSYDETKNIFRFESKFSFLPKRYLTQTNIAWFHNLYTYFTFQSDWIWRIPFILI